MFIDHSKGFEKRSLAIVPRGPAGEQDDYYVYGAAQAVIDGVDHVYYSGTRLINNDSKLSRQTGQIFLSTSLDGETFTKQGVIIPRDFMPGIKGLSPFDYALIDDVHHLFVTVFGYGGEVYNIGYFTSADGVNWGGFTFISGLDAQSHGASFVIKHDDPTKAYIFYTQMSVSPAFIKRATVDLSDISTAIANIRVTQFASIYPSVEYKDGVYQMLVAKPIGGDADNGYLIYKTASLDGEHFPDTNSILFQRGDSGAFDEHYTTTPNLLGNRVLYSGRASDNLGYRGIGVANLDEIGGVVDWDWSIAAVGKVVLPGGAGAGIQLVPSSKGSPAVWVHKRGLGNYEAVIYDDMSSQNSFQNTFRVTDENTIGPLLGIWCGTSKTKYIYRTTTGVWQVSSVNRSAGLHTLTMEVTATEVTMKIDGTVVAVDTAFDTAGYFRAGFMGYWKSGVSSGNFGTALVKSLEFSPA